MACSRPMEHTDVERAVREWLDATSINPATGVPPDARVAVSVTRITPFGQAVTGDEAGAETFSVTATLFFPQEDHAALQPKIKRILERFQGALDADPAARPHPDGLPLRGRGGGPDPLP